MPQQPTLLARTLRQLLLGASLSLTALPAVMAANAKAYHIAPTTLEAALNQFGREAGVLAFFASKLAPTKSAMHHARACTVTQ